jgi:Fic family protein
VGVLKLINEQINAICNLSGAGKTESKSTMHESRFSALSEGQKILLARIDIFLNSRHFSIKDVYNSGFSHPNRMESVINNLVELGLIQKSPKEDKNTIDQIYFLSSNYLQIIKEFKKTLI